MNHSLYLIDPMQIAMLEDKDLKVLRNRLLASALVLVAFLLLLTHAKHLYFGNTHFALVPCCEQAALPSPQNQLPSGSRATVFELYQPYQLTPQELSELGPIPPDEWTFHREIR